MNDNPIIIKSKKFAIRIVRLCQHLCKEHREWVLSNQLLRSGTSIGANIRESMNAQSKADFIAKLSIALKEASESTYWLELLFETEYISDEEFSSLDNDVKELTAILTAIIKSSKRNLGVKN